MEQLIAAFGIDLRLIIIQVINFTLLVVLLSYFLYKPILRLLKEREEKIAGGLRDAEAAAAAKEDAENERRKIIAAANTEAVEMTARAEKHAVEKADSIVEEASLRAANVLASAESVGQEMKAKAIKESEAEIAKMAILAAEKVLKERSL